jgi:hypothetical protein
MKQTSEKSQTNVTQNKPILSDHPMISIGESTTQQGTIQNIEKTVSEKVITNCDWLTVSITLWPIAFVIAIIIFKNQIASILEDVANLKFGNFSLTLRSRIRKMVPEERFDNIKALNATDLKVFFVLGSQFWKIKAVTWNFETQELLASQEKLEKAGLIVIKNKASAVSENDIKFDITEFGREFYQQLASLISEFIQ